MTLSLHSSRVISEIGDSVRARVSIPATSPACQDLVDIIDSNHELVPFGPRGLLSNEFVCKIRYSINIKLIASYHLHNVHIKHLNITTYVYRNYCGNYGVHEFENGVNSQR